MTTYEDGMAVRREVLGDDHVDRATGETTDLTHDFQQLITEYAWGAVWTRAGSRPSHPIPDHDHRPGRARPPRGAGAASAWCAAQRRQRGGDQGDPPALRGLLRRAGGQHRLPHRAADVRRDRRRHPDLLTQQHGWTRPRLGRGSRSADLVPQKTSAGHLRTGRPEPVPGVHATVGGQHQDPAGVVLTGLEVVGLHRAPDGVLTAAHQRGHVRAGDPVLGLDRGVSGWWSSRFSGAGRPGRPRVHRTRPRPPDERSRPHARPVGRPEAVPVSPRRAADSPNRRGDARAVPA